MICLFILFIVFFAVKKFLGLGGSNLFLFLFPFLGDELMEILLQFMSDSVLPLFSSKSFIVSGLTLWPLIHFELIFVFGVKEGSDFIFFHVAVQFSQHHLLKRLSFQHCVVLPTLSEIN